MPSSFIPPRTTPFDVKSTARALVPKRYPIAGFATLGVYFFGTLVVAVIRFGMDLHEPVSDLTPPTPPAFGGSGLSLPKLHPNAETDSQPSAVPSIPDLEQFRPPPPPPPEERAVYPRQEAFPSYPNTRRYDSPARSPERMIREAVPAIDPRLPMTPDPYAPVDPYPYRYGPSWRP